MRRLEFRVSNFGFLSGFGDSVFGFQASCLAILVLTTLLVLAPAAYAQRPYIGYTYPAGGQQGTTIQVKLGGQNLDDVNGVLVSGPGVKAKVVEYLRRLNNQEQQLLGEQLKELKKATSAVASAMSPMMKSDTMMAADNNMMMMSGNPGDKKSSAPAAKMDARQTLIARIDKRTREFVQTPACNSISSLVIAEVTFAPNAEPGAREIRLVTPRGVSNPLVFHVGQVPETCRPAMITATIQVLGKEASALRKRPTNEVEVHITVPCTVNGQIASGEENRYRFEARKGQRLVISTQGRALLPYIADAVPGWFQPVLVLSDANGKEVAYDDDYRFMPDPTIFYEVPKDGPYTFQIHDSIYRGREDFVYRITIGETPFVTSIFPLGTQAGVPVTPRMKGWNLQDAVLTAPPKDAAPGLHTLVASRKGIVSNPIPFAVDKLPSTFDTEPNNLIANAQKVALPVIINGRIDRVDDWDVFAFTGKSNDTIVAEVMARRLDSPLDSVIKLTDATGKVLAFSDDHEDLAGGANTHQADSYFLTKLPSTGTYYVHIGDTARKGGDEYAYRLRLSAPQPDFELRATPSSARIRTNSTTPITVFAQRQDGFKGPIKLELKHAPAGFSAVPVTLPAGQNNAALTIQGPSTPMKDPVSLVIIGTAKMGEKEITHEAVPAEDRMQAFLWRHLVPARDLKVLVYDPNFEPPLVRPLPRRYLAVVATNAVATSNEVAAAKAAKAAAAAMTNSPSATNAALAGKAPVRTNIVATTTNAPKGTNAVAVAKPRFSRSQVTSRLRELKLLFEEGLLTEQFCSEKAAECEAGQ